MGIVTGILQPVFNTVWGGAHRLGSVLAQGNRETVITTADELQKFILGALGATSSGVSVTPETAMRVSTVYGCVGLLTDVIGTLPSGIMRADGNRRIAERGHPVDRIVRVRPNSWQTPFEWKRMIAGHLLLRGNHYGLKVVSRGAVRAVIPLHPDRMTPEQRDDLSIIYKYQRADGRIQVFRQDEIFHVRALSTEGVRGLSPISAAKNALGLAVQTETHGGKLFANAAKPGGVLKHPSGIGTEAVERLRAQMDEISTPEGASKTLVLEEGMDWTRVGMTGEESQFLETRKFQRGEICAFFRVPPWMIADVEKTTSWGSGVEQQSIGFVVYTVMPWTTNIEQAIQRDLLSERDIDEGLFCHFNEKALLRGDFKSRQEGLQIQRRNGVVSANEWRAVEDMNPREDEGGDEYIVEQNMRTNDGEAEEPEPAPIEEDDDIED